MSQMWNMMFKNKQLRYFSNYPNFVLINSTLYLCHDAINFIYKYGAKVRFFLKQIFFVGK